MNAEQLRTLQAPIKERYKKDPAAAVITLRAQGRMGEGIAAGTRVRVLKADGIVLEVRRS